jgi:mono/diheme cytochrome c family protein
VFASAILDLAIDGEARSSPAILVPGEFTGIESQGDAGNTLLVLLIAGVALAQDGTLDFASRCSVCHGADGHGTERGPNLAKSRQVRSLFARGWVA